MADLIRFVDSIDASPTVRLDLNDEVSWFTELFSAPPPRLRRSVANNSMRDGIHVGSSTYDARTLPIVLTCRKANQDDAATEMQKLWRELDREKNYLMYQPQGAAKPVFFVLYRSDTSALADVMAQAAMRTVELELLAEPHALGLMETLGPYTVNNDPQAASNPCYFDTTAALGDAPAPAVVVVDSSSTFTSAVLATGPNNYYSQAEAMGGYTDTSVPGGGPDAAMSGTGTNNYARTTFATDATMVKRLAIERYVEPGTYRVLVPVRRSEAASVIKVRLGADGAEVATQLTTSRQLVDLGLISTTEQLAVVGYASASNSAVQPLTIELHASRASGAGTLDWDYFILVPASQSYLIADTGTELIEGLVLDGVTEEAHAWEPPAGDPLLGTAIPYNATVTLVGGFPCVTPGEVTRFHFLQSSTNGAMTNSRTASIRVAYWPRYVHVRPATS